MNKHICILVLYLFCFSLLADKRMYDEVRRMRMRGFSAAKIGVNRSVILESGCIFLSLLQFLTFYLSLIKIILKTTKLMKMSFKMSFQNDPLTISHFLYCTFRPDQNNQHEPCDGKIGTAVMFGRSTTFLERNR